MTGILGQWERDNGWGYAAKKSEDKDEKRKKEGTHKDIGGSDNEIGSQKMTSIEVINPYKLNPIVTQIKILHFMLLDIGFRRFIPREENVVASLSSLFLTKGWMEII